MHGAASAPAPLMELTRNIKQGNVGDLFEVLLASTDAGSQRDIPLWVQKAGHELLGIEKEGDVVRIRVRKTK
ncbi:MAG: sulfurtransferase TusA family protein [Conexivisphaera sp.]